MFGSVLYWLQSVLKTRQILHNDKPYLERSYVCTLFGWRVYLHRFVACDEDGLHDHPFEQSFSIILKGWYWEDRWAGRRKVRFFNHVGPDCLHRIILPDNGKDVWTLFFHTERTRPWGFFRSSEKSDAIRPQKLEFVPASFGEDPPFSDWSKNKKGAQLRSQPGFYDIPRNKNAYSSGFLSYPKDAYISQAKARELLIKNTH